MNIKKLFEIMSKATSLTFTDYGISADNKTYAVTIEEFSGLPKTAEKVAEEKVSEPKVVEKVSDAIKTAPKTVAETVSETTPKTVSKEIKETPKAVQNTPKKISQMASFMVKSDEWSEKILLERIADFKTKFKKRAKEARVKIAYIMDKVSVLEENQKYIKDIGYKIKALKNVNLPEALDIVNDSIKSLKGEKTAQSVQKTEDTSIVPYEAEARYYVRYYWLKLEDEVKSHALCAEFVNSMGLKITAKTASFYCPVIHDEDDANIVTSRLSVISWQTEHPNENVAKCSEDLGLSMSLCRRWWNFNEDIIRINTTDLAGNPV